MTFSEFIKMLYRFIGGDTNRIDFMVELTTEIMKKSFTDKKHPFLSKSQDMMGRIFNGTKGLPQKDAKVILFNLDRERFVEYLLELPLSATNSIGRAMREKGLTVSDDEIIDLCADLFISILEGCVQESGASTTKTTIKKTSIANTKKKVSQAGTPAEQMRKVFEEAVRNHNIAGYICKLADYLNGEEFYSADIFKFIENIQSKILAKFVKNQDENIFKNIASFNVVLNAYCGSLGMLRPSISEVYGLMWRVTARYDDIFGLINKDRTETKEALLEEKNKIVSLADADVKTNSLLELESKINQLDFLELIFLRHKEIISLFEEICNGKTLLVF